MRLSDRRWLLALDPSSVAIGWAWFNPDGRPVSCGVVKSSSADVGRRVDILLARLESTIGTLPTGYPTEAAIETNTGREFAWQKKVGQRSKSVTATLCRAQGRVEQWLRDRGLPVTSVPDSEWTKGKGGSAKRLATIRACYPEFSDSWSDGGDAEDAIGVGLYHLGQRREAELIDRATTTKARA